MGTFQTRILPAELSIAAVVMGGSPQTRATGFRMKEAACSVPMGPRDTNSQPPVSIPSTPETVTRTGHPSPKCRIHARPAYELRGISTPSIPQQPLTTILAYSCQPHDSPCAACSVRSIYISSLAETIMLSATVGRPALKPSAAPAWAPHLAAGRAIPVPRPMLVRAEADKVAAAAKDLAAKGLDALRNIDKEKVRYVATTRWSVPDSHVVRVVGSLLKAVQCVFCVR